jgi:large subunit ribosomal protein L21
MYAVIKTGGKQYRVIEGQNLKVETLPAELGATVDFQVLMVATDKEIRVGEKAASGKVQAKVVRHGRGDKVKIVKFRRRKHYRKQMGHRQNFTEVQITSIA